MEVVTETKPIICENDWNHQRSDFMKSAHEVKMVVGSSFWDFLAIFVVILLSSIYSVVVYDVYPNFFLVF